MKLIKPSYEIISENETDIIKQIEAAARTCYKSESKIGTRIKCAGCNCKHPSECKKIIAKYCTENIVTDDMILKGDNSRVNGVPSDIELVYNKLIANKHEAMLEFGNNIIFKIPWILYFIILLHFPKFFNLTFSKGRTLISGSIRSYRDYAKRYGIFKIFVRSIIKSNSKYEILFDDISYNKKGITFVQYNELKLKTIKEKENHINSIVKFICDRGVSHELVRHRVASFAQESTRYCNYGKEDHIQFIIPCWLPEVKEGIYNYYETERTDTNKDFIIWLESMYIAEEKYNVLLNPKDITIKKWSPQEARSVLPNSLKTEINICTNLKEWKHIFKLRTAKAAHPQMRELMCPLLDEFKQKYPIIFDNIN